MLKHNLFLTQLSLIVFINRSYGAFTSELDKVNVGMPLEISKSKEFNITLLPGETININVTLPSEAVFALVQTHSFQHNNSILHSDGETRGTNIGVILFPSNDILEFLISNPNKIPIKVLGIITPHDEAAPIPGGCSPSNESINPNLLVEMSKNLISLNLQSALEVNMSNGNCSPNSTRYRLFFMYTTEKDFSIETYFEGIRSMVNDDTMKSEASEYKRPLKVQEDGKMHIYFAKYPGTGILFKLISYSENGSSSYVIGHSFGCNLTDHDSCSYLVNTFHRVEVVILCVAGVILCFCGYEWKSFELCVMSFILCSIPIYTGLYNLLPPEENIIVGTISGFIAGGIIIACVSCYKCVHAHHATSFITFGLIISSALLFFVGVGNSKAFHNNDIYWATYCSVGISIILLLSINSSLSHYFTTSVIGSFMVVLTIDYFAGSSLKYIIFDNIRRLSVDKFTEGYIVPPFQTPDILLTVLWTFIAIVCSICQFYRQYRHYQRILKQFTNNNIPPAETHCLFDETSPLLYPDISTVSSY